MTRETLIAEATALFAGKGYADASISDICERAGITKGALFHHFKSKKDLFMQAWTALQLGMDSEARAAAIAARSRSDPYAAFLAGCRVYLEWASRADYQTIVLIDGPSVLGQVGWYENDHDLGSQNVTAGMRYLSKKGLIEAEKVPALAVMMQNALNGAGFALSRKVPGVTRETVYAAFEAMLRALR